MPDLDQFYTSTIGLHEEDRPSNEDLLAEALTVCRAAWPDGSRYRIDEAIAAGGMGAILKAWDHDARRYVAMKVMLRDDLESSASQTFLREAHIVATLEHPNIVPVHEVGATVFGDPYFTMKWVQGDSLAEILKGVKRKDVAYHEQYPLAVLLDIMIKIAEAIDFAHSRGIWHLDLKPHNILIGMFGEVVVLDWGLARDLAEDPHDVPCYEDAPLPATASLISARGVVRGTPGFMAPEQAAARSDEIDQRADIFALGSILYTMVTGEHLISGDSSQEMIQHTIRGNFVPPGRRVRRAIPKGLEAIVMKCIARNPEGRYYAVGDMIGDLQAYSRGQVTSAEEASMLRHIRLFVCRFRSEIRMVLVGLLIVLGLGTVFAVHWYSERLDAAWYASGEQTQVALRASAVDEAQTQRRRVRELSRQAAQTREAALDQQYSNHLARAAQALAERRLDLLQDHLEACPVERRHWEWFYLQEQVPTVVEQLNLRRPIRSLVSTAGEHLFVVADEVVIQLRQSPLAVAQTFAESARVVDAAYFEPKNLLLTASQDGNARIWNMVSKRQQRLLYGHKAPLTCVACDGQGLAATGDAAGVVFVWEIDTGRVRLRRALHAGSVKGLAFTGGRLLSMDDRGQLYNHSLRGAPGPSRQSLPMQPEQFLLQTGTSLLIRERDRLVQWNLRTRTQGWVFQTADLIGAATLGQGGFAVSKHAVWDIGSGGEATLVFAAREPLAAVVPLGVDRLLVAGQQGLVSLLDTISLTPRRLPTPAPIRALAADARGLLISADDQQWRLAAPAGELQEAPALPAPVWRFGTPTGEHVVCDPGGTVSWGGDEQRIAHMHELVGAGISADAQRLFTVDRSGLVCIWNTVSHELLLRLQIGTSLSAGTFWGEQNVLAVIAEGDVLLLYQPAVQ